MQARVENAREVQAQRYESRLVTNASVRQSDLEYVTQLTPVVRKALADAVETLQLTGRGVNRVRRIARTIADLEGETDITEEHLLQALLFRYFDASEEVAA